MKNILTRAPSVGLLALLTASCAGVAPAASDDAEVTVAAASDAFCAPHACDASSPPLDVKAYKLKASFDWQARELGASVRIDARTCAPDIVLDSEVTVDSVKSASGQPLPFQQAGGKLTITVPHPGDVSVVIGYAAAPSAALQAIEPLLGDPAQSRVLYTYVEPLDTPKWLPCHNDPSDRATFSAELTIGADEMLVSNGDLVKNHKAGHKRVVKYATKYSIPTYLMAIAVGDFEKVETKHKGLPVGVWHRRHVSGDFQGIVGQLTKLIDLYQKRLETPYPFEKYEVVLLPAFPVGGEEHAGITFQSEDVTIADPPASLYITAHELAHQWFGDLVTVRSWDDLWVKEGNADLLTREALRSLDEPLLTGPAGAYDLYDPDAIVDPGLAPHEKYTTGPYKRAAWLLQQIRTLVGEDAFWATQRQVLKSHAFGSISTDEYVGAFAPLLSAGQIARVQSALVAHALPSVGADDDGLTMTLDDPEGSVVAPIKLASLDGSTIGASLSLDANQSVALPTSNGTLLFDVGDTHYGWLALASTTPDGLVAHLGVRPPELAAWSKLPAALQGEGFYNQFSYVTPEQAVTTYAQLGNDASRELWLEHACAQSAGDPAGWRTALRAMLDHKAPTSAIVGSSFNFSTCRQAIGAEEYFAGDLAALEDPSVRHIAEGRAALVMSFGVPASRALTLYGDLIEHGHSWWVREQASNMFLWHAYGFAGPEKPAAQDFPAWRASIAHLLHATHIPLPTYYVAYASVYFRSANAADNAAMLGGLIDVAHNPLWADESPGLLGSFVQEVSVCRAFYMGLKDGQSWDTFKQQTQSAPLRPEIRALFDTASTATCI